MCLFVLTSHFCHHDMFDFYMSVEFTVNKCTEHLWIRGSAFPYCFPNRELWLLLLLVFFPALSAVATNTLFCSSLESQGESSVWFTALGRWTWGTRFQRGPASWPPEKYAGDTMLLSVLVCVLWVSVTCYECLGPKRLHGWLFDLCVCVWCKNG